LLVAQGQGKATRYQVSPAFGLLFPIVIEQYFEKEIDERDITAHFNQTLIRETLPQVSLFSAVEIAYLSQLQQPFLLFTGNGATAQRTRNCRRTRH